MKDDVRVREVSGGASLSIETGCEFGSVAQALVHDLDGDRPRQPDVVRDVDRGHAPAGKLLNDLIPVVNHVANKATAAFSRQHISPRHGRGRGKACRA